MNKLTSVEKVEALLNLQGFVSGAQTHGHAKGTVRIGDGNAEPYEFNVVELRGSQDANPGVFFFAKEREGNGVPAFYFLATGKGLSLGTFDIGDSSKPTPIVAMFGKNAGTSVIGDGFGTGKLEVIELESNASTLKIKGRFHFTSPAANSQTLNVICESFSGEISR